MKKLLALTLVFAVSTSLTMAATLTTIYAWDNDNLSGGAVYFDLVTNANGISITGFDVNTPVGNVTFSVYTRTGTSAGFEATPSGWSLAATGTGTGQGMNLASSISLSNSFNLLANSTYGFALVLSNSNVQGLGQYYTSGTGSNQTYSNADFTLNAGSSTNVSFGGLVHSPRVWNGTIYYNTFSPTPEPFTMGLGLAGAGLFVRRRIRK